MPMNARVNGGRLWDRIMEMGKIGETPRGGSRRLALTHEDKLGRDLFVKWCKELGCEIQIDRLGNIFATRPGRESAKLPVSTGSHLDTQPHGGKFDGIYGVLAGVEVLEVLNENNIETLAPIQVCVWTNEEGARFSPPMIASGVYAGEYNLEYALNRQDEDGITLDTALKEIGYRGDIECGSNKIGAFIEAHIEQGPILEREDDIIGVVTKAQGIRWFQVEFRGQDAHTGSTPMAGRKDALLGAAHAIVGIQKIALDHEPHAVATVGRIENIPNSNNTISGSTTLIVDMRNPDEDVLDQMESELWAVVQRAAEQSDTEATIEVISRTAATHFDEHCANTIEKYARHYGYPYREMVSGAGHDACFIARVAPAAMIFIPCKDGLSHNEAEYAKPEHLAAGAQVLLATMVELANKE